jgi:hypothetical protein
LAYNENPREIMSHLASQIHVILKGANPGTKKPLLIVSGCGVDLTVGCPEVFSEHPVGGAAWYNQLQVE